MNTIFKNTKECSEKSDSDNTNLLLTLLPTSKSNSLCFANINLLINNSKTINGLLLEVDMHKVLKALPSHFETLIRLDTFKERLNESLSRLDKEVARSNYALIINSDYRQFKSMLSDEVIAEPLKEDNCKCSYGQTSLLFN